MDILNFFQDNGAFTMATVENGKPNAHLMRFLMDVDRKLSFCASMQKAMFKQMKNAGS
jgi:uncharacterized pyridoxamine 5'-phosphate oxidase family protein